jgi:hypothetical protein
MNLLNYPKSICNSFWKRVTIPSDYENDDWEYNGYLDKDGYGVFHTTNLKLRAHVFAYQFYIGQVPLGLCVCHSCDVRNCCSPYHLFVATNEDNTKDRVKKKRSACGELNGYSSLSNQNVLDILDDIKLGKLKSIKDISCKYNIHITTVHRILDSVTWRNLTEKYYTINELSKLKSKLMKTFDENDVIQIKNLLKQGYSGSLIARKCGVDPKTISNIKLGVSWSHVKI